VAWTAGTAVATGGTGPQASVRAREGETAREIFSSPRERAGAGWWIGRFGNVTVAKAGSLRRAGERRSCRCRAAHGRVRP
jgi:hypothetical protein